ncbi:MAG: histidine phosphatase family protein [Nitrospira sp.]|nr:MAG: histidine phosphatase family protein [Nitrospira sp.]
MDCLFVRHGLAVEREEWDGKDVDRPLTEEGTRRVRQVAAGLRRLAVRPTVIYASPARRAVLGMAASLLLSGRSSESFPLKKAGACLIDLSIPVKPGQGLLRWWLTPGQLRAMGRLKAKD